MLAMSLEGGAADVVERGHERAPPSWPTGSSAARTRCPSVCPRTSRTPVDQVRRLRGDAARRAGSQPCHAGAGDAHHDRQRTAVQTAGSRSSADVGQAARVVEEARPCAVVEVALLMAQTPRPARLPCRARCHPRRRLHGAHAREDCVVKSTTLADHHGEPAPQRRRVGDIAGLDRPLDATRIGRRPDRPATATPSGGTAQRARACRLRCH